MRGGRWECGDGDVEDQRSTERGGGSYKENKPYEARKPHFPKIDINMNKRKGRKIIIKIEFVTNYSMLPFTFRIHTSTCMTI